MNHLSDFTYINKAINGWRADTKFVIGNKQIALVTSKRSNGKLMSNLSVGAVENGFVSYMMYQDFNKMIAENDKRCTEKNIIELHLNAVANINRYLDLISQQYCITIDGKFYNNA
jgi:hypothetical protein